MFLNLSEVLSAIRTTVCHRMVEQRYQVWILHASFPDFLLDSSRSKEYYIDSSQVFRDSCRLLGFTSPTLCPASWLTVTSTLTWFAIFRKSLIVRPSLSITFTNTRARTISICVPSPDRNGPGARAKLRKFYQLLPYSRFFNTFSRMGNTDRSCGVASRISNRSRLCKEVVCCRQLKICCRC